MDIVEIMERGGVPSRLPLYHHFKYRSPKLPISAASIKLLLVPIWVIQLLLHIPTKFHLPLYALSKFLQNFEPIVPFPTIRQFQMIPVQ